MFGQSHVLMIEKQCLDLMVIFKHDRQEDFLRTIKKKIHRAKEEFSKNEKRVYQVYH